MVLKRLAAVAAAVIAATGLTTAAAAARPLPPAPCTAWVSNPHPQDYSTEVVDVSALAGSRVTTIAWYRTVRTVRYATYLGPDTSGLQGERQPDFATSYWISDATPRYRVLVQVYVKAGLRSGYCTTSFTPQRRPVFPRLRLRAVNQPAPSGVLYRG